MFHSLATVMDSRTGARAKLAINAEEVGTSGIVTRLLFFGVYLERCSLLLDINRGHLEVADTILNDK